MTDEFGAFNPFEKVGEEDSTEEEGVFASEKDKPEIPPAKTKEGHQQAVERADQEKLDEIEDEYKELDEKILDIDEGEDTMWLIQRMGVGILKIAGIVGIIIFLLWSIWGRNNDSKIEKISSDKKIEKVEKTKKEVAKKETKVPAKKISTAKTKESSTEEDGKEGFWSKLFSKKDSSEKSTSTPEKTKERVIPAVSDEEIKELENSTPHTATIEVMAWNYWMEKNRLLGQKNSPGEVALWTKDTEALFDVPFAEQVKGNSDTEREKKVEKLINNVTNLLRKAEILQTKLLEEIYEFSAKEELSRQEAIQYEEKFLEAMNKSDPTGIDQFLKEKISAEKKQIENGIERDSRKILAEKIDSYAQILMNLREDLIANKKALIKDVQVVSFPEDPFHRVLSIQEWENLGVDQ